MPRPPERRPLSAATQLLAVSHVKLPAEAMIVMTPEHQRVYEEAGWSKDRFYEELEPLIQLDPAAAARGVDGMEEGLEVGGPSVFGASDENAPTIRKLPPWSPMVIRVGGGAGAFSAILQGWVPGSKGSTPITHPIGT